jgi:putative membrane protein
VLGAVVSLPVAALLAADRARALGHALVEGHVVGREGSLVRRRRALDVDHVIGWNYRATWFQRRVGLTSLVATTAGGAQAIPILDIPEGMAVELSERALPDLVSQFRR